MSYGYGYYIDGPPKTGPNDQDWHDRFYGEGQDPGIDSKGRWLKGYGNLSSAYTFGWFMGAGNMAAPSDIVERDARVMMPR